MMSEFGRPSPSMILKLMKDNNIYEPNQVIKVGDTYNDILEGINANCFLSVGVLTGQMIITLSKKHIIYLIVSWIFK